MKLSKYASLVKRCGRCIVARVEGSGLWLGTDSALYRATELPEPAGEDQVRAMLDLPEKAWNKVYMSELRAESAAEVLGMDLSPYAAGEQDADKQKLMAAHNGLWCACYRCREDGELIFFDEAALGPVMEELRCSDYIRFTVRRAKNGARYLAVHDGFDVLAAILPVQVLTEEYMTELAEFQALCTRQYWKDRDSRPADGPEEEQMELEGTEG